MWAYTESPLIDGNALICSPGGGTATVVALNKKNGEVIWKASLEEKDAASYSSPIVATIDGTKQYVLYLGKGVVGLRADTGELLWRYTKTSDAQANIATPVVNANFVYTGASRVGGGLVQVSGKKSDPKEIYFAKTLPGGMGGCVLVNGYLYGSTSQGNVCVDYATARSNGRSAGLGQVPCATRMGDFTCMAKTIVSRCWQQPLRAIKNLDVARHRTLPIAGNSKAWTHPIIANGKLYIRDQSSIWCYDIAK